jgi:hypothetical protein
LERRAERLGIIPQAITHASFNSIPGRVRELLNEASDCYVIGAYHASLAVLAAATEYALQVRLRKTSNEKFRKLLSLTEERGLCAKEDMEHLKKLLHYRNNMTHSNLNELTRGVKLIQQEVVLTNKGILEKSEWEEFIPIKQEEKEMAISLGAQMEVAKLLVYIRSFLYRLFDGVQAGK